MNNENILNNEDIKLENLNIFNDIEQEINSNLNEFEQELNNIESENISEEITEEDEDIDEEITNISGKALLTFGSDITLAAREGKIEECFGREKELAEMMEILVRRQKNNPVLVGEAGVGKTSIIELFATRMVNNQVPFILANRAIISIDLSKLIAGTKYRGEFESRIQSILSEALNEPNIILFIDEIHNLVGSGGNSAAEGMDAANMLKPALSRSGFQCIGATTNKEYERIEKDPALNRRFQPIQVEAPSISDTVQILYNLRPTLEGFHNVTILSESLKSAAELSERYITDRNLPDKAIDLLDRAAAREVIKATMISNESVVSKILNTTLNQISKLRIEAFRKGDITAEYIFQEIENAYKTFLLKWIENPLKLKKEMGILNNSTAGISTDLIQKIKIAILQECEKILFSPLKEKNKKLDLYTISTKQKKFTLNNKNNSLTRISSNIFNNFDLNNINEYLVKINYLLQNFALPENFDFCLSDYTSTNYIIEENSLSNTQANILSNTFSSLKPVLAKGVINSLIKNSDLKLSKSEKELIFSILGYSSKEKTKAALNNIIDNSNTSIDIESSDYKNIVSSNEIKSVVAKMTGLPLESLSTSEIQKLINLENNLHKRVIGQEEAVSAISKAIRRARLGIQNPNRPIASFFFCGPTGVGKTELTKALAATMFGSEDSLIRFDMSEFMEKFTISRLIGSPPGYVGYEDGGQLTNAVKKKPYSVVLLDEIEKAHPEVLNILLQILDDGRLTDSQKNLINFENTIIIMTSNAAADEIQRVIAKIRSKESNKKENINNTVVLNDLRAKINSELSSILINKDKATQENKKEVEELNEEMSNLKSTVLSKLSTLFLPEFLNRLDDIIIFQPLKKEELRYICDIMVSNLQKRLKSKKINLIVEESVREKLTHDGYNPAFGARPLRRQVTKNLEDLVSEMLLKNPVVASRDVIITLNENKEIIIK